MGYWLIKDISGFSNHVRKSNNSPITFGLVLVLAKSYAGSTVIPGYKLIPHLTVLSSIKEAWQNGFFWRC
jgi:hypothetical protein